MSVALAGIVGIAALAGCGGDDTTSAPTETSATSAVEPSDSSPVTTAPPADSLATTVPAPQDSSPAVETTPDELGGLKVAVVAPIVGTSPAYMAKQLGYFDELGLDVEVIAAGSNVTTLVASGQADLAFSGAGAPIITSLNGKQTSVVAAAFTGANSASVVVGGDVQTFDDLKGQRLGTLAKGTASYGWAVGYDEMFDLGVELVPYPNYVEMATAVEAGHIAGGVGTVGDFLPLIERGNVHVLLDTSDVEQRREVLGPDVPDGVWYGIETTVQEKRPEVVAFLAGLLRVGEFYQSHEPAEIVDELVQIEEYKSAEPAQLTGGLSRGQTQMSAFTGAWRIEEDAWDRALQTMTNWGIDGYDASAAAASYGEAVDMSYLDAAENGG
ncbi:MAG TPA: ABC transporter substrate-binding protein [Ilumatobacter sp.]|nr:ABC transporter substrate-binding protein [Ilumatobacter sp.]